jgi:DUF2075 family protein
MADHDASDGIAEVNVGCVYTVQSFEFDYFGVIWGRDLRWDPATNDRSATRASPRTPSSSAPATASRTLSSAPTACSSSAASKAASS